jgi:hypothetical protein
MSLLNGSGAKAREVLDFCLSSESPTVRSKVYEIVNSSGLEPDDPLFLVLVLTGQMRVLLEAAPAELSQLLSEWKNQNASSLLEITEAIALVKQTSLEQAEAIRANMEAVSQKYIAEMKQVGMDSTSAIAEANGETLSENQKVKKETQDLVKSIELVRTQVDTDRQKGINSINAAIKWANNVTESQEEVNRQINKALVEIGNIQRNKIWLRIADVFWSLPALVASGLILVGGTWMIAFKKYNSPNTVLGHDLVEWNVDRLNNCYETKNPKCTLFLSAPGSPERKGAE